MKKYSTILVDDEYSSLKVLESKIQKHCPSLNIVGTFQKPEEAIRKINQLAPDILFLDIQMPNINGFELLERIDSTKLQVIFCTAFGEYALQAIKKSAVDYILKPVDKKELVDSVQKAVGKIKLEKEQPSSPIQIEKLFERILNKEQKISIPTSKGTSFIPLNEVIHLQGYEGYTRIHLKDETVITSSYSLGKFKEQLNDNFFKCHKSHIVNLNSVRAFENEGYVVLVNNYRVPISRSYKQLFIEMLKH